MNIWSLPKVTAIRMALLRLSAEYSLEKLLIDYPADPDPRAVWISDRRAPGLNAYLFTYGQSPGCYGLQLSYPTEARNSTPAFPALEEIGLKPLVLQLGIHFELA